MQVNDKSFSQVPLPSRGREQERGPDPTPAALEPTALLYYAGLLAGLGAAARSTADHLGRRLKAAEASDDGRTCIDGGSALMFSLLAPGRRSLRVLVRDGLAVDGVMAWSREYHQPGPVVECWQSETFAGEVPRAWDHALEVARGVSGEERLHRDHRIFGPRGWIYSLSWSTESHAASVSWRLDRTSPPEQTLALAGLAASWPVASEILGTLLGQPIGRSTGPWSILRPLDEDSPRVRIGTTSIARLPEDDPKRRRLATLVDRLGGDGRYAEALYKLVDAASPARTVRRIARAVEVEMLGDQFVALEVFLAV